MSCKILDKTSEIREVDKSNMISFCTEASKHYGKAAEIAQTIKIDYPKPKNIIVAGMGGSAIGGDLLKDWARNKISIPIEVSRDYMLPAYTNKNSLVLIASYSGDTEESLSTFLDAKKRGCMIYCISSGGSLLEVAGKLNVPYLQVPGGMPPRAALPYLFTPLLMLMVKMKLASSASVLKDFSETVGLLEKVRSENSPLIPAEDNFSKTLACNIGETTPIVYGFGFYRSVAQRFKQQFNENSKAISKWEVFPELNHNEIVGWEKAEKAVKNFTAIFLRDINEPEAIRTRIEVTKTLLQKGPKSFEVWSQGKSELAKMLSTVVVGDFTSVYLAILRRINPTPVETITLLKDKLKQSGTKEKIMRELEKLS